MHSTRLEGVAADVLSATGCDDPPVDAFELAACCGLHVELSDVRSALLYDETIYVSRRARVSRVQLMVAHEIGHWALRRADQPWQVEPDADYIAAALLVPWRSLARDLRGGWDLDRLRLRHPNAPASVIAARVAIFRDAGAAIYDGARLRRRIGPAILDISHERQIASEAIETGRPVRLDDRTGAWPVIDGRWRRAVVLAASQ